MIAQTWVHFGSTRLSWLLALLILIIASCLLLGLMTPIVAIVIGLGAIGFAFSSAFEANQTLLNLIVLTTAIALLGPGAFSIDARMFGRRQIFIPHTSRPSKS